jgi:hypothetical protein
MQLQFYKANKAVTGSAVSFNIKEKSLFVNFLKQASWNESKRTGSFRENIKNPGKSGFIKFSISEAAGIIDAINRNEEFSYYHSSPNGITCGAIKPYMKEGKQIGFSFGLVSTKKGEKESSKFGVGITFPESIIIKFFLESFIKDSFYSEAAKENDSGESLAPSSVKSEEGKFSKKSVIETDKEEEQEETADVEF